jgi:metallo-beta-lactamase family protein
MEHDENPFDFSTLRYITDKESSQDLNQKKEPCIIISASGMAEAGRVKHHIANSIQNSRNTILLAGYCEPNSLGGRLKLRPSNVTIFGEEYQVKAEIAEIKVFLHMQIMKICHSFCLAKIHSWSNSFLSCMASPKYKSILKEDLSKKDLWRYISLPRTNLFMSDFSQKYD